MNRVGTGLLSKILTIAMPILHFATLAEASGTAVKIKNNESSPSQYMDYIGQYRTPEFFSDNELALQARLKILDQLPAGGIAKIMTFHYDNGDATRLLAVHMCKAAKRGVQVEFLPDSKTGDRPGVQDAFDSSKSHRTNEDVYQLLANCGVQVKVHNHIPQFDISILTSEPMPGLSKKNILTKAASRTPILKYGVRYLELRGLLSDLGELLETYFKEKQSELKASGLVIPTETIKTTLYGILEDVIRTYFEEPDFENRLARMATILQGIQKQMRASPHLKQIQPRLIGQIISEIGDRIHQHETLGEFYRQARLFNRLNHRKLFWVSYNDQSCMFLGGRNLGDHYLTWKRPGHGDEFMDGDVFICRHHLSSADADVFGQAQNSFDELWLNQDPEDPTGVKPMLTEIKKSYNHIYRYLIVTNDMNTKHIVSGFDGKKWHYPKVDTFTEYEDLKRRDRVIPKPMTWKSTDRIAGTAIEEATHWRVATSTWNREKDEVRKELYQAIQREQQVIYIETAYAELSSELRRLLEDAIRRGVQVRLITNSIYVSDAGSKAIRLVMARWLRQMLENHPQLFSVQFATIEHGHMLHFKGAAFQCQKDDDRLYRMNLVGSHNFHARSGYSDKEHAILWEQLPRQACRDQLQVAGEVSTAADLMNMRDDFYQKLSAQAPEGIKPLKAYRTFEEELQDGLNSGKLSKKRAAVSLWILKLLYEVEGENGDELVIKRNAGGRALLRTHDEFIRTLEILSESGMADLVGTLL